MGLLDQAHSFAQGASNGVAGSLTGPVDGLAWLLRKAGVPVPQAPLGGSDWMRSVGLMQEPKERMAGLLGEGIGSALPTVIAGKAPQIAGGLLQMERNAMAPRTLDPQAGAVLWHGSPHKFDKFDSSKIGTGEGAQAYGHGLYLAENPGVARQYSQVLSDAAKLTPEGRAARALSENGDDLIAAKQAIYREYNAATSPAMQNAAMKAIDVLQSGKAKAPQLYKVDLPDEHIAKMLDWDKPLSQQAPEVQAIFGTSNKMTGAQALKAIEANPEQYFSQTMSGKDLTGAMIRPERGSSEFLKQKGIPGIRYLDGGSRGAGAGSSNYVVFPGNEGLLKILERNGQGLLGN